MCDHTYMSLQGNFSPLEERFFATAQARTDHEPTIFIDTQRAPTLARVVGAIPHGLRGRLAATGGVAAAILLLGGVFWPSHGASDIRPVATTGAAAPAPSFNAKPAPAEHRARTPLAAKTSKFGKIPKAPIALRAHVTVRTKLALAGRAKATKSRLSQSPRGRHGVRRG